MLAQQRYAGIATTSNRAVSCRPRRRTTVTKAQADSAQISDLKGKKVAIIGRSTRTGYVAIMWNLLVLLHTYAHAYAQAHEHTHTHTHTHTCTHTIDVLHTNKQCTHIHTCKRNTQVVLGAWALRLLLRFSACSQASRCERSCKGRQALLRASLPLVPAGCWFTVCNSSPLFCSSIVLGLLLHSSKTV